MISDYANLADCDLVIQSNVISTKFCNLSYIVLLKSFQVTLLKCQVSYVDYIPFYFLFFYSSLKQDTLASLNRSFLSRLSQLTSQQLGLHQAVTGWKYLVNICVITRLSLTLGTAQNLCLLDSNGVHTKVLSPF